MATTTTHLGLPIPEDSDPVMDGGEAIRDLGNAIDAKFRRGSASATADGIGDITVTHGVGAAPTAVLFTSGSAGLVATVHTITSTTFKVRFRVCNTNAAWTGTASGYWLAIA